MKYLIFFSSFFYLLGCQKPHLAFEEVRTPCINGGESNLFTSSDGSIYLSWIEYGNESNVTLLLSKWVDDKWGDPLEVSKGDDWFVNWADFPSVAAFDDNNGLVAHWLQKSAEGTYDYDVMVSWSHDEGKSWTEATKLHSDTVSAEHGFVSMTPISDSRIVATWLDGRNTKVPGDISHTSGHDHGHHGAMSLRGAEIHKNEDILNDQLIDEKVCDCCQTSTALTASGPIVVYRDRSDDEIRDIYISRQIKGKWLAPKPVYNDNWHITGCPVNGPVVRTHDNDVAVAWFTMADEVPQVNVAFSYDGGVNFDLPLRIDNGDPLGRLDLLYMNEAEVFLSWLEQVDTTAILYGAIIHKNDGVILKKDILTTSNARQSGFPRMTRYNENIFVSWTAVDSSSSIKTGIISF